MVKSGVGDIEINRSIGMEDYIKQLEDKIKYLEEQLVEKDRQISELVSFKSYIDNLKEIFESTIKEAEHKAAMKTFNQRVASGEVKPAKRADIDDRYIAYMVKKDVSAYKIAQSVGMTPQAILYRIKKIKEADLMDSLAEMYRKELKDKNTVIEDDVEEVKG